MLKIFLNQFIFNKRSFLTFLFFVVLYFSLFKFSKDYKTIYDVSDAIKYSLTILFVMPSLNVMIYNKDNFCDTCKRLEKKGFDVGSMLGYYILSVLILSIYFALPFIISDLLLINMLNVTCLEFLCELLKFISILLFYIILAIPTNVNTSKYSVDFTLITITFCFIINVPYMLDCFINYLTNIDYHIFIRFSPIMFYIIKWCKTWNEKDIAEVILGCSFEPVFGIPGDLFTMLLFFILSFLIYKYIKIKNFHKYIESIVNKSSL